MCMRIMTRQIALFASVNVQFSPGLWGVGAIISSTSFSTSISLPFPGIPMTLILNLLNIVP